MVNRVLSLIKDLICLVGIHWGMRYVQGTVHLYYECEHCSKRAVIRAVGQSYIAVDQDWLDRKN